jgi:transcriptional regulator with XRE-family HTH domain
MKPGKAISGRLRDLREAAGLSQQEVAMRADLSLSLVAKLEQGKKADPRASTLIALARALGIKPGAILDDLAPLKPKTTETEEAVEGPVTEEASTGPAAEEAMAAPPNGKAKKKKKDKKPGKLKKK